MTQGNIRKEALLQSAIDIGDFTMVKYLVKKERILISMWKPEQKMICGHLCRWPMRVQVRILENISKKMEETHPKRIQKAEAAKKLLKRQKQCGI